MSEAVKITIDDLTATAAELRRLHQFEVTANVWNDKTEWVQKTAQPGELGKHRADVLRQRIERLQALNAELVEALQLVLNNNECLLGERVARAAMAKAQGEMK